MLVAATSLIMARTELETTEQLGREQQQHPRRQQGMRQAVAVSRQSAAKGRQPRHNAWPPSPKPPPGPAAGGGLSAFLALACVAVSLAVLPLVLPPLPPPPPLLLLVPVCLLLLLAALATFVPSDVRTTMASSYL